MCPLTSSFSFRSFVTPSLALSRAPYLTLSLPSIAVVASLLDIISATALLRDGVAEGPTVDGRQLMVYGFDLEK